MRLLVSTGGQQFIFQNSSVGHFQVLVQSYDDGVSSAVFVSSEIEDSGLFALSAIGLGDRRLVLDGKHMGFGVELSASVRNSQYVIAPVMADISPAMQRGD